MNSDQGSSLILVTGGARSGKSTFAENLAEQSGKNVTYLATARVDDQEMRERVDRHRVRRPKTFCTVEEPLQPHLVLEDMADSNSLVLLDCLTLLVSNRILADLDQHGAIRQGEDIFADDDILEAAGERVLEYMKTLSEAACKCPAEVVVVTNEVGMGIVPNYPVARVFRDYSGRSNQVVAAAADQVWLVVCGIPQRFK